MDRLARTVREQIALGRLLPLGGPEDAAWITERTAVAALRAVCAALPGVRLGRVDVVPAPDDPDGTDGPDLPAAAPTGALPHQPLRIRAGFEAAVGEPLPAMAERLRTALFAAAGEDGLGLPVRIVDLAVTGLIDDAGAPSAAVGGGRANPELEGAGEEDDEGGPGVVQGTAEAAAAAVRAVPGVSRLTRRLSGRGGVRVRDTEPPAGPAARHVQLQIATARSFRPLAVARQAAAAAANATAPGAPGPVSTAVVITDIT